MDRRVEILKEEHQRGPDSITPEGYSQWVLNAMDVHWTERAMELLEYMARNKVICGSYSSIDSPFLFEFNGQIISKEKLFENFL